MIKHVVLFKFISFNDEDEKQKTISEVKDSLYALKSKIDCLIDIEVGINANINETYDMALLTTFASMEDLERYAKHPDHLEVAKMIGAIKADRACVDFKF